MILIVLEQILYVVTAFLVYFSGIGVIRYLVSRHSLKKEEPTPEIESDQVSVDLKGINNAEDILDYIEALEKATTDEEVIELTRLFDNPNRASIKKEAERQAQEKCDLEEQARQAKVKKEYEKYNSAVTYNSGVTSKLSYYDAKRETMVVPTELLEDYPLTDHDYEIKTLDLKGGYTYICMCYWCERERKGGYTHNCGCYRCTQELENARLDQPRDQRHPGGSYSPGAS